MAFSTIPDLLFKNFFAPPFCIFPYHLFRFFTLPSIHKTKSLNKAVCIDESGRHELSYGFYTCALKEEKR